MWEVWREDICLVCGQTWFKFLALYKVPQEPPGVTPGHRARSKLSTVECEPKNTKQKQDRGCTNLDRGFLNFSTIDIMTKIVPVGGGAFAREI